jgi:hypothetical protein
MIINRFQAGFPWGVLLVSDADSKEEIPSWATAEDQVAVASTAVVVRVMHEDNGEVAIRVLDDVSEAKGDLVFSGPLLVPSGTVRISDALGASAIELEVEGGSAELSIHTNDPAEATEVDLVMTPLSH